MSLPKINYSLLHQASLQKASVMEIPDEKLLALPEKVLQFGTGVLLRGLPDYFIDKANKAGIFQGRIVVVKSTESSGVDSFSIQQGLYVQNIRGIENGKTVNQYILNGSISRVLSAKTEWQQVLDCAANPELSIVISNTTEVGITLVNENIGLNPPCSFPAKLVAFLYQRFKVFKGSMESGMVILPTELIVDNGDKLKDIVLKLAAFNKLENEFTIWLNASNTFCNTLVDRIVPGKPEAITIKEVSETIGLEDDLLIMSEPYSLWAIQGNEALKNRLTFYKADKGVVIDEDITPYRERKLRLLNGGHTISVGLAFLAGLNTVSECMEDSLMEEFIKQALHTEIVPSLDVDRASAVAFANEVLDRFRNPFINHLLLNITLQYTTKMNMRNAKTIISYHKKFNEVPLHFALGFAAYLLFMKTDKVEGGKFFGVRNGEPYLIQDTHAAFFYEKWNKADVNTPNSCKDFVNQILHNEDIWEKELKEVTGFSELVSHCLFDLIHKGIRETLDEFVEMGQIDE